MPRMQAPESGITVRMYRQGHGDCFLLAMRKTDGSAFYTLIDCGLWTNSEIKPGQTMDKIIADIAEATGNRLDIVLVTHEHMDHVNGFAEKDPATRRPCFDAIEIGELWLSWTEDEEDEFANGLREHFHDTLLALMGADERLERAGLAIDSPKRAMLRDLLSFETGEDAADGLRERLKEIRRRHPALSAREQAVLAIEGITNKRAIKYLRDRIDGDPVFLRPEHEPYPLKGVEGVRVYALGPPRDAELLLSLEPRGEEAFGLSADDPTRSLLAATTDDPENSGRSFDPRFGIPRKEIEKGRDRFLKTFFAEHYGPKGKRGAAETWRQIDTDWLAGSESLALRLNNEVNNTSLVVAIELTETGKVLLFTGDAQRGSWISWSPLKWTVAGRLVTARELLGRTIFYKAGHHGSHNATLDGSVDADYANISWLAKDAFRNDFVAVIPANTRWANEKKEWEHPRASIEARLKQKARGRVFRSDIDHIEKPEDVSDTEWQKFNRVETDLFFEYTIPDTLA
ncbi:MBL fold metallo-hydrolase [Sinorhizobium numidicum]|uniref:MBL fold metallo-hydrolase n=1 Tax=Sinorhizobium numidicum TaxID=680248 RepID=A0ABY8CWC0_9HYPH|nr:MBL fold metallo-hydrolase [Sinorhizobium numidicum]WEX76280.1 MBL fold metallo-hydrolase [Sinorhizobium numidicum]WEX82940.1 MBL fold metallo-hydrolase [Sinorhizobium numidicum]